MKNKTIATMWMALVFIIFTAVFAGAGTTATMILGWLSMALQIYMVRRLWISEDII